MDVIFDIDGTLVNIEHRLPHIMKKPKDWDSFRKPELKELDTPRLPVIQTALALQSVGHRIILCTARIKSERYATIKQLCKYFLINGPWEPNHYDLYSQHMLETAPEVPMYMRSERDFRPDSEVKKQLLSKMRNDGYEPELVFDDRPAVIDMWREQNLTVADVGPGIPF